MLRKALYSAIAAIGASGFFAGSTVEAHPPTSYPNIVPTYNRGYPQIRSHYRVYTVLFRTCDHEPWRVYAQSASHDRAHDLARRLRHQGLESRVQH